MMPSRLRSSKLPLLVVAFTLGALFSALTYLAWIPSTAINGPHHIALPPRKFAIISWQAFIPRRAIMRPTVGNVSKACEDKRDDLNCRIAMFSIDLLRISRLFNPTASFFLLADYCVLWDNAYHLGELEKLGVQVRYSANYRTEDSRAARYDKYHYAAAGQIHPPEMLSRFCEMADLAKEEGLERVITTDTDVGFFTNVAKLLDIYPEDIVSPCPQCSQMVLWTTKALDAYCDGLISFWRLNDTDRNALYAKYGTENTFSDMHFLWMFREENNTAWAHNFTSVALVRETPSPRNPYPNFWGAAATAMTLQPDMVHPRGEWFNTHCDKFNELVAFAPLGWSYPYVVPLLTDLHLPLSIIHFHQACKHNVVHQMFFDHYRRWYFPLAAGAGNASSNGSSSVRVA